MRRFLGILGALALATSTAAIAADMPVKAPPLGSTYPTARCGLYYGVNVEGGAGTVQGTAPGTTVIGGDVGGLIGYACPIGTIPFFAEVLVDFQNLNAGNSGFSLTGPAHIEERAGVQTPLLQLFPSLGITNFGGTLPSLPVLPPGTTFGQAQNYIYVALNEDDISSQFMAASARDWLISPEVGTGMLVPFKLANGTPFVADVWAGYEMQSSAICLGGAAGMCPKLGGRFKVGTSFKY
jgi:hypothetical protein